MRDRCWLQHLTLLGACGLTLPEPTWSHLNPYVLPVKCSRSLVSRTAVHDGNARNSAGFAAASEPDAAALEVVGRQSPRYLRAGKVAAAGTHFTTGVCRLGAGRESAAALVPHRVHQHRGRDLAGNAAAAGTGIAAGRRRRTYHRSTQPFLVGLAAAESGRSRRTGNTAGAQSDVQANSGHHSKVMDPAAAVVGGGGHAEGVLPRQAEGGRSGEANQFAARGVAG